MAINEYLSGINNATAGQTADVNTASSDLSALQVGAGSLPAKLKEALNLKLNNNKDIIDQQSSTMQNYFNSGAEARSKYQDVFNPFEKAKLVQQDRSMALRPYDTLSGVLENRMGTVADTVTAGVQGWQGMVNAGQTKLDTAKSMLTTALSSYMSAADQQQAADDMAYKIEAAKEASRQFEKNYGLESTKVTNQASQFDRSLAQEMAIARLNASANGGGGVKELSPADKLALGKEEIIAMGKVEDSINGGNKMSAADIRSSLMKGGFDPNDAKFAYLYSYQKQAIPVNKTMQNNLSSLWNNTKYWLSSGQLK